MKPKNAIICASYGSYVGESTRHLSTKINEHLRPDKTSHVYNHVMSFEPCNSHTFPECLAILDQASTPYQLKIKEAIHIFLETPKLNRQIFSF